MVFLNNEKLFTHKNKVMRLGIVVHAYNLNT